MNKLILCTALIIISLQGTLFAQTESILLPSSKTEMTFNSCKACYIHIKDIVVLRDEKMTLELFRIEDYELLKNMDSILMNFRSDIAFYKDSLEDNAGTVRIDYVLNLKNNTRKIRFIKHPSDGQLFVKRNSDISRLKIEQDTVHIVIENTMPLEKLAFIKVVGEGRQLLNQFPYSMQVTFQLNNYTDVDHLIADKVEMRRIIDTLQLAKQHLMHGSPGYIRASSSIYRPYASETAIKFSNFQRYREFSGVIKNDQDHEFDKHADYLTIDFNMGAGLIRNTFAPSADLGLQIIKSWRRFNMGKDNNFFGAYFQPIFFFDRNSNGDFITNTNAFVNFHYGAETDNEYFGLKLRKVSFGAGYLVLSKGNYFKKNTFKLFMDMQLAHGFTLSPELIATDNFKQIFPGITLKVF